MPHGWETSFFSEKGIKNARLATLVLHRNSGGNFFCGGDGITLPNSQQQWNKFGTDPIFPNFFSAQGKILLYCNVKKPSKNHSSLAKHYTPIIQRKHRWKKIARCFLFFSFKKQRLDILFLLESWFNFPNIAVTFRMSGINKNVNVL